MCVDVRGCSRGIRVLEREFSRSMSEYRAKAWIDPAPLFTAFFKSDAWRRFLRETKGTRGAVLNRKRPNFPTRANKGCTSYIEPVREI